MGGSLVELSDAASVDRAARVLFGSALDSRPLVSHSGAVWNDPESELLTTLRIGEYQPKSDLDFLALHIGRARADAIVITGKILRDEPALHYDLRADPRWGDALVEWRERRWGLWEPPWLLILTGSGQLDFAHPAFHGWARPVIFTSDQTAERKLADSPVPVVADAEPDIRKAIHHLHAARDCQCVSIEAGPVDGRLPVRTTDCRQRAPAIGVSGQNTRRPGKRRALDRAHQTEAPIPLRDLGDTSLSGPTLELPPVPAIRVAARS